MEVVGADDWVAASECRAEGADQLGEVGRIAGGDEHAVGVEAACCCDDHLRGLQLDAPEVDAGMDTELVGCFDELGGVDRAAAGAVVGDDEYLMEAELVGEEGVGGDFVCVDRGDAEEVAHAGRVEVLEDPGWRGG